MCKFKQIYKNMPVIGFFVKAGKRFAKRMEPKIFFDTNLLINIDPVKMGNAFASRMVMDVLRSTVDFMLSPPPFLAEIGKFLKLHAKSPPPTCLLENLLG